MKLLNGNVSLMSCSFLQVLVLDKNLTACSYSMPLKTPNTKLEVIPPKDVEADTFEMKTTPPRQFLPKGLTKILLGIPMVPILNFLGREYTFTPIWCIVSELWLFV